MAVSGKTLLVVSCKVMSSSTHISTLYREFADALRDVLAENAAGLASRGRLARTRAAVKKHPDYSEHGYFLAVEMAFDAKRRFTTKDIRAPIGCATGLQLRFRLDHLGLG